DAHEVRDMSFWIIVDRCNPRGGALLSPMNNPAIRVENVGKRYRIGTAKERNKTFREAVTDMMAAPWRSVKSTFHQQTANGDEPSNVIWALRNVSFEIKSGEVIGIIGRNGAGKSTLLKILSRITEPTEGRVVIRGRVGSLLEVGTGFHSELTGEENIYLSGTILGMRSNEISRKFDEIVAFAEMGKFIHTPVKHYSSGMYMRLAFAVAAHLEPEILLVDEVLAVGDAAFQKKCLGKMGAVAREGRTVLFVSHNMTAVQSLCERVVWLKYGNVAEDGPSSTVVSNYLSTLSSLEKHRLWTQFDTAPGNEKIRLRSISVSPVCGTHEDGITVQTPLKMTFEYWNLVPDTCLNLSVLVFNMQGIMAFNTAPIHEPIWNGRPFPKGLFRSSCYIPADLLNDDTYTITLLVVKDAGHILFSMENAAVFEVIDNTGRAWHGKWPGVVRPNLKWETEILTV
ncbi:MAG: ABC transporter ATP-binding protein, partial [Thermodesulfobacteriota bacterium]